MTLGPHDKKIVEEANRSGLPIPEKIANAPRLQMGLELYYDAFLDLNTCRSIGWGVGPIPWTSIADWANVHGLDADQRDRLFSYIPKMDQVYRDIYNKKGSK